jgi:hypothetical protein
VNLLLTRLQIGWGTASFKPSARGYYTPAFLQRSNGARRRG